MPPTTSTPVKATAALPWIYRFLLMNLESTFALGGNYHGLTQESVTFVDSATDFVYTQLAGGWAVIVFIEAVIMRQVDDLRVWKLLCGAILASDALYTHSLAQALGGWQKWAVVSQWTLNDWVATVTTWPFIMVRLAIVLGIGYRKGKAA